MWNQGRKSDRNNHRVLRSQLFLPKFCASKRVQTEQRPIGTTTAEIQSPFSEWKIVADSVEFSHLFAPLLLGKLSHNYGKSQFLMDKLTISMAMFNSHGTTSEYIVLVGYINIYV